MKTGVASSSGVFYEAFCGIAAKYEAPQMRYEAKPFQASCFFVLKSRQKNGGEGVNFSSLDFTLKNRYITLIYPELWHFIAHHRQNPEINKTGKKWGKPHFMGKKWGSLLFAYQPISEPGIKPSSLLIWRHQNIAQNNRIST